MKEKTGVDEVLETVARILWRCTVLGFGMILFWACLIVFLNDFTYQIQTFFLKVTQEQFGAIHFAGIGLAKVLTFWLFLAPLISIKLVLRSRARSKLPE
jgi:hypothetical protein